VLELYNSLPPDKRTKAVRELLKAQQSKAKPN